MLANPSQRQLLARKKSIASWVPIGQAIRGQRDHPLSEPIILTAQFSVSSPNSCYQGRGAEDNLKNILRPDLEDIKQFTRLGNRWRQFSGCEFGGENPH